MKEKDVEKEEGLKEQVKDWKYWWMEGDGRNMSRCSARTPNAFVSHSGLIQRVSEEQQSWRKNESS